ncbi:MULTISPECIES: S26 family signal peptidase [Caulobacter]|jgi:conjugative transfer signal peptidase TraF|uniref:Conjugation peptidase TraF n=1 Tax=Caulobacter vibrioides OR37 TaxID=1292034 RepID=R0E803_CAUVI|nr:MULTISPECIES: S26 family signal peptidase [Caulobacter]ENZ81618.1 conjugation peptidase TraF [Caulobacter vibrioides OR37]PIB96940.1 peptidase [Caulobacter sp. X]
MKGWSFIVAAMVTSCALVVAPVVAAFEKRLILNTTASAPLGFYWLDGRAPRAGDLALVRPPMDLARWMASRRYLPLNVPLIKRIAAVKGQSVCIQAGVVHIDGVAVARVLDRDRLGRTLTASTLCRHLGPGEIFLLNADPRSLDGRYFGPLPRQTVVGRLTPLWTWER